MQRVSEPALETSPLVKTPSCTRAQRVLTPPLRTRPGEPPHWSRFVYAALGVSAYPAPPLHTPGLARDGLPGGGGRRSPSDGLPGGGEIARVFQGKLWYPPPMQAHVHQVCVSGTVHGHREKRSWV